MSSIDTVDLKELHDFAITIAQEAGQILIEASSNMSSIQDNIKLKVNTVDIVTSTDIEVEQFIRNSINERYPSHKFIGEETYSAGQSRTYSIRDEPTWCIDPLDGTVNFVHLFPMICISLGFTLNGKPVLGVIHAPFLNQTYSAYKGGGSWLNKTIGLPIQKHDPLPVDAPRGCIFSCEWGKDRKDKPDGNLMRKVESFVNMACEVGSRGGKGGMVHGIRSLGSAALDLCFVATGAFDIWWEGGCWEWDVCAGIIIVEEAGGLVTCANAPVDPENSPIKPVQLGSRLYLAIRSCAATEDETSRQQQERVVREVWKRVGELDYERPLQ